VAPLLSTNAVIAAASATAVLAVLAWYKRCRAAALAEIPLAIFLHCLCLTIPRARGIVRSRVWLVSFLFDD
jgi:hypothetical protein